jgi:hypothetical protein
LSHVETGGFEEDESDRESAEQTTQRCHPRNGAANGPSLNSDETVAMSVVIVRRDSYHDSVLFMRISQELRAIEEIDDAVVAMGTPHNLELIRDNGYGGPEGDAAGPNDLVIAVKGASSALERVDATIERLLKPDPASGDEEFAPPTLRRDRPASKQFSSDLGSEYLPSAARLT